jgi:transposase InsO family protein
LEHYTIQGELPPIPRRLCDEVQQALRALAAAVPPRRVRMRAGQANTSATEPVTRGRTQDALLLAERLNHIWSADLTTIELGRTFYLAAILDLYSRKILAWTLFPFQPGALEIRTLFETAVRQHGQPDHFVTDKGKQFEAGILDELLDELDVGHRIGAVGRHGSIALIERLWRTAKETLDFDSVRPNVPAILAERIAVVIDYYNTRRPHMALGNATPEEIYTGRPSRAHSAKRVPRAWRGEPSPPVPFVIRYAFPHEHRLPYLERIA